MNFWNGFEKRASTVGKGLERIIHGLATRAGKAEPDKLSKFLSDAYKRMNPDAAKSWKMSPELLEEIQVLNVATKKDPSMAEKLLKELAEEVLKK